MVQVMPLSQVVVVVVVLAPRGGADKEEKVEMEGQVPGQCLSLAHQVMARGEGRARAQETLRQACEQDIKDNNTLLTYTCWREEQLFQNCKKV